MEDDPAKLAERMFAHEKLTLLVGTRVRFKRQVERDTFAVAEGMTGTIVEPLVTKDAGVIAAVKLDVHIPGAEPYEHEVHWGPSHYDQFEQDLESII